MSAFFDRDRREVGVEDVAIALTLALDFVANAELPAQVRLEVSAGFGAWLEWLLEDEATQARLLREFEAGARVGIVASALAAVDEEIYSSFAGRDVCSATLLLWRFVSAHLAEEAAHQSRSARVEACLVDLRLASAGRRGEVLADLNGLACRWRSVAWFGRVYPLSELMALGGSGHLAARRGEDWR